MDTELKIVFKDGTTPEQADKLIKGMLTKMDQDELGLIEDINLTSTIMKVSGEEHDRN